MSETELERVRAEFEQYMEAAHKAGVVFSIGQDGVVRAEYNPALAKCVASWDVDGEIEQPMPDKANEHAPSTGQDSQAETTAGKPSPAALPAVENIDRVLGPYVIFVARKYCGCVVAATVVHDRTNVPEFSEEIREWLEDDLTVTVSREKSVQVPWECARHLDVPVPDSTRKRDGVSGDVQPPATA